MKTRLNAESITGCMDFGRQTSTGATDGATDTFFGSINFFCTSTVFMGLKNRTVDLGILFLCLGRQHFKDPLPDATRAPAHVARVNYTKAD